MLLDRVTENVVAHVPEVAAKGQDPDRDPVVLERGSEVAPDRDLEVVLAVDENRRADRFRKRERDRAPRQNVRATPAHAARGAVVREVDRDQDPERADPDERCDPEVVLDLAVVSRIVKGEDPLPSKSRGQNRVPYHPDQNHAAVLGLCRSPRTEEVALGRDP